MTTLPVAPSGGYESKKEPGTPSSRMGRSPSGRNIVESLVVTGNGLTIESMVRVARHGQKVELCPEAAERIQRCRKLLEDMLAKKEIVYGVNTGIGEFSEMVLADHEVKEFQRHLIHNHAAGIGEAMPLEWVRAAMVGRVNVHAHGHSAMRLVITECLIDMINKGVTPFVCLKGSVGACGDLAPMSQIALLLMGEGKAYYKGELLAGDEALRRAEITPPGLEARDGLATINGSNVLTAMSAIWLYDANNLLKQAEIACAMSLEALCANLGPLNERIHSVRGFLGAQRSAKAISQIVQGGDLAEKRPVKLKVKVQDAYSMRSSPQVIGAAHDAFNWSRSQVEIELNGVGDNPIFFPEFGCSVSGANFQGTPVSLPMDMAGVALTMVCVLAERRLNRLNNPHLSGGLPPFLSQNPGMMSGMMLSQYTADMLLVEQKMWSAPASIQSIPAAADQEDFVSMGFNTALKNMDILRNAYGVIGIEMMLAAQGLDLRKKATGMDFGRGTTAALQAVRKHVTFLDIDRPLCEDHNTMSTLIKDCVVLRAVEEECGSIGQWNSMKYTAPESEHARYGWFADMEPDVKPGPSSPAASPAAGPADKYWQVTRLH